MSLLVVLFFHKPYIAFNIAQKLSSKGPVKVIDMMQKNKKGNRWQKRRNPNEKSRSTKEELGEKTHSARAFDNRFILERIVPSSPIHDYNSKGNKRTNQKDLDWGLRNV